MPDTGTSKLLLIDDNLYPSPMEAEMRYRVIRTSTRERAEGFSVLSVNPDFAIDSKHPIDDSLRTDIPESPALRDQGQKDCVYDYHKHFRGKPKSTCTHRID